MRPSFAILFDLDDTLIDRQSHIPEHLRELDQRGHGPRQPLFQAWPIDQPGLTRWICERLRPDPELLQLLRELPCKALVSNGGGETQRAKLMASGLDQVFLPEHIHISGELPWAKPDARIFQHACQKLGRPPEDCIFLGDHEDIDRPGAERAGLRFHRVQQPLNAARLRQVLDELAQIEAL